MIWVISTGEAFWQHNISRHPKHLLQHLSHLPIVHPHIARGGNCSRRRANCACVCPCVCVYCGTRGFTIFI